MHQVVEKIFVLTKCGISRLSEIPFCSSEYDVNHKLLSIFQAYVNMALFENFTYAGIDATAEEA